ncbi:hypothetical protein E4K72_20890 [Oxalobacteraceae bacterium OM1]|nr:hypothetical protein E4K72_20890 [Oxalobacteraceae bacterium OM1]
MSIAVSAVIRPSRTLRAMLIAMSSLSTAVGIAVFAGTVGDLPAMAQTVIAALCVFPASFGFYHGIRHRETLHIDISSAGQIRIEKEAQQRACTDGDWPHVQQSRAVVHLMRDSTMWPNFMLLRLCSSDGRITVVPVMKDSVSSNSFRALSVACRWIAARGEKADHEAEKSLS